MLFKLKDGVKIGDLQNLVPALMPILSYVILYCHNNEIPCVITSLISDRDQINAQSKTHQEGRAFDVGINGWTPFHISRLVYHVNLNFKEIAAISSDTQKPTAAIDKPHGTGPHIHFQVKPNASYHQFLAIT